MGRPYAWEASYPAGMAWDAPIAPFVLTGLLDDAVADHADRPALEFRGREIDYRTLAALAEQMAAGLIHHGLAPGDRVALYVPNTPSHPIALFGALKAGGIVVQLSPLEAERDLVYKLCDSGARILVTTNISSLLPPALRLLDQGHLDRIVVVADEAFGPEEAPRVVIPVRPGVLDFAAFAALPRPAQWPPVAVDDIALLQYTGGTTGQPKAAILSHANLSSAIGILNATYRPQLNLADGEARALCVLPLFHIFALTSALLLHLWNGSRISLRMRFDPVSVLDDIERLRITHVAGVPTMWIALAATPGVETRDLASLVYCLSGGAPLPVEVQERVERVVGQRLNSGWGMTELSPPGIHTPLRGEVPRGSIGLPQPGIRVEIVAVDDPSRVLEPGEPGEMRVKGPNVTRGYWRRPEETAAAFVDGWFLTGDIAVMDAQGFFTIVDRKKDMIISGGFNVYPQQVEQAIYEHPDVEEAVVIGIPDAYRGESAKAYIKLRAGAPALTLEALCAFLASRVGRHEMPRALELRPFLPRTSVGKLSRKELREEVRAASATD